MVWFKSWLKNILPRAIYRIILVVGGRGDFLASLAFMVNRRLQVSVGERLKLVRNIYRVSLHVQSLHTQAEILEYIHSVLTLPASCKGVIVEAGCGKGSGTAKFSLAAKLAGRQLVVFDSFQGVPENVEPHDVNIFGKTVRFVGGHCSTSLEEVKGVVEKYGALESCRFIPGWFEDSMPAFDQPIAAIYLDVNLAQSTRTCLKYLYPLLEPQGVLYSQDGHLPLVITAFDDDEFWQLEVGCPKPHVEGLGVKRLIKIVKQG